MWLCQGLVLGVRGMVGAFFGLRPVSKTSSPLKSIYRKNHTLSSEVDKTIVFW